MDYILVPRRTMIVLSGMLMFTGTILALVSVLLFTNRLIDPCPHCGKS